jgi:hypothetical protein
LHKVNHIWLQGGIPDEYTENFKKWSSYDNKVWNEEELLGLCTDEQVEQYTKIESLINRVNYLKYILLYSEGGIYADLDSYPVKKLKNFFRRTKVQGIDKEAKLSIRYPFNTGIPNKLFSEYDIIIPGRKTMSFYPNGAKPILLDNPILISKNSKNQFWLKLIQHCLRRKNSKPGLPHEPFGPYGMTDFLFTNYYKPYQEGILVLPPQYLTGWEIDKNTFIVHEAKGGWK